jgi:hypothetical protein
MVAGVDRLFWFIEWAAIYRDMCQEGFWGSSRMLSQAADRTGLTSPDAVDVLF